MKPTHAIVFLISIAVVSAGCGDDDDSKPATVADAGADSGRTETPIDAGPDVIVASNDCAAATAGLAQSADANAPVLDAATSNLVKIEGTNATCTSKDNGKHPAFGPVGYQLSIAWSDADGDGPAFEDVSKADVVRLASDPNLSISTLTDPAHFSTGGNAIIIQLCLDRVYAANELAIGFDIADKAGHRAKAICVRQQSGR